MLMSKKPNLRLEGTRNGSQNQRKKIIKNTGVKVDEDRFKIHNSIHNNFAIRYFNMVASYLSGHKK